MGKMWGFLKKKTKVFWQRSGWEDELVKTNKSVCELRVVMLYTAQRLTESFFQPQIFRGHLSTNVILKLLLSKCNFVAVASSSASIHKSEMQNSIFESFWK